MNNLNKIRIAFNNPYAKIPTRGTSLAAGYDLYSTEDLTLNPGERKLIDTGVVFEIPKDYYGRIAPRSGLAFKNGLDVMAGIIDADFRGSVKVLLINLGNSVVSLNRNDRIAQIIFLSHESPELVLCSDLSETVRNTGGLGSTGN